MEIKFKMSELKFKKNKGGSILLEALLSILILSVSIVMINQSLTASLRSLVYTEDYTQALIHMENQIFNFMYLGFIENNQSKTIDVPGDSRFSLAMNSRPASLGQDMKLNKMDLTISWKSGKKKNSIVFETYLFPPSDEKK